MASIIPSSIENSPNALSTSAEVNLSPKVIRECLNLGFKKTISIQALYFKSFDCFSYMSASILPLTSKASKALRMVSSSSAPILDENLFVSISMQ